MPPESRCLFLPQTEKFFSFSFYFFNTFSASSLTSPGILTMQKLLCLLSSLSLFSFFFLSLSSLFNLIYFHYYVLQVTDLFFFYLVFIPSSVFLILVIQFFTTDWSFFFFIFLPLCGASVILHSFLNSHMHLYDHYFGFSIRHITYLHFI